MRLRLLICCLIIVVYGSAQTLTPDQLGAQEFSRLLDRSKQTMQQTYLASLQRAELALLEDEWSEAVAHFAKAAESGSPNSRWYLGMSRAQQKLGDTNAARAVLEEGYRTYPYSSQLGLALFRLLYLSEATVDIELAIKELKLKPPAAAQAKALLAFRQNKVATGLLETERAHYLAPDEPIDPVLSQQFVLTLALAAEGQIQQAKLLQSTQDVTTLEAAYLDATFRAATKISAATDTSVSAPSIKTLADFRTVTLREFVQSGHLGRFQDPMLVDLYVLDRQNHLTGATLAMLFQMLGRSEIQLWEQYESHRREIEAAIRYMDTRWAADVEAFLAQVGH